MTVTGCALPWGGAASLLLMISQHPRCIRLHATIDDDDDDAYISGSQVCMSRTVCFQLCDGACAHMMNVACHCHGHER